jgi:hypothetical protein
MLACPIDGARQVCYPICEKQAGTLLGVWRQGQSVTCWDTKPVEMFDCPVDSAFLRRSISD